MSETHRLASEYQIQFLFAGNSTLTVLNTDTGNHFTFRVKASRKRSDKHFVQVMSGPDNERSYTYLGSVYRRETFYTDQTIQQGNPPPKIIQGVMVFQYILKRLNSDDMPPNIELYHEGRCGHCNRKLTTPESIISGIGPICDGRK